MSQKLFKSTSLVAGMTLISRLLGFVRDVVLAQIFGAGPDFDAFVIAFKIPNFMRRLFGEGAFSQAFVPILTEYRIKKSPDEVRVFIDRIAGTLSIVLLILIVVAEVVAPFIIMVFAPGFFFHDSLRYHYAIGMLRITFPYLLLIALTAFAGAILNTSGRFGIPAFTPVLLNVALIAVALLWAPYAHVPIFVLAWGVLIGGCVQLFIQLPFLKQLNLLPTPRVVFKDPGVMRVMKLMIPALFGVSVAQISLLVDNVFASFLLEGSIAWLYYSDRLTYLPLGVIGIALTTVVMPHLSRQHSARSVKGFSNTLDWALRTAVIIGVPAAVGLFVLAGPLLATLIYHGAFSAHDVIMTRKSLMAFAVGLPSFMLVKILASAFYSQQNIKTPVKVAVAAMLANLILNLLFIVPLQHTGLALATSLASWVNSLLLLFWLLRKNIYNPVPRWWLFITRIGFANMIMAAMIGWLAGDLSRWLLWGIMQRIWHLTMIMIFGIFGYFAVLWITGLRICDFHPPK